MTMQHEYGRRRSGGFFAFLLALVLGAVALGMFLRHAHNGMLAQIASAIVGRPTTIDVSAPVVVDRIQQLARLETVVYSLDTVVVGQDSSALLPDALTGDKLLLIVHGQTIAGVDLRKLKPEDVQITESSEGRAISVTLPPSEIFITSVDNQHTHVYQRDTGLLVSADPNLETTTRAKAQDELQKAALDDGILDAAAKNARGTIAAMLGGLGFAKVEVK
jgi:hypothetical protein